MQGPQPSFDPRLVEGFSFTCRVDCALCCYTTPAVQDVELRAITSAGVHPQLVGVGPRRAVIASRPNGGACTLLQESACSIHPVRPGPCAMFPVTVHGGPVGWQASVVLSCPGLTLERLLDGRTPKPPLRSVGLVPELTVAQGRAMLPEFRSAWEQAAKRRRRVLRSLGGSEAGWDPEALRAALRGDRWPVDANDLPGELPPAIEEGAEYLPLVWLGSQHVVGIEGHALGFRLIDFQEQGPTGSPSEVFPMIRTLPAMTDEAQRLLDGYLAYWLERDVLFDQILLRVSESGEDPGPPRDQLRHELSFIGATVLARAVLCARARGDMGRVLNLSRIEDGIRATDMDLLDRPSLGVSL